MVIIAYLTSSFPVIAADFENMEVSDFLSLDFVKEDEE
jgi:hypothetical protein